MLFTPLPEIYNNILVVATLHLIFIKKEKSIESNELRKECFLAKRSDSTVIRHKLSAASYVCL